MLLTNLGFSYSSVGKQSACNARDPSSIPGSGRSTGERIGYPLQYSWASPVTQLVKNLPAMRETWVRSLGWEDPLKKEKATHSNILAWRIPWTVYIQSVGSQRVGCNRAPFAFALSDSVDYTHFLLAAICLEYHLSSLHSEPMFFFRAEVSLLEAAYS